MPRKIVKSIEDISGGIRRRRFSNEAAVSQGVVLRLLRELRWPVDDTRIVWPQFDVGEGKKIDYALCHPMDEAVVLLEVKRIGGIDVRAEVQLFKYCTHHGVPIAVLTDGKTWSFYRPAGQGRTYEERRFAQLDLTSNTPVEFADGLQRYLAYEEVRSGQSQRLAEEDHAREQLYRVSESVWRKLVRKPTDEFLDMFVEAMRREATISPSRKIVAEWLHNRATQGTRPASATRDQRLSDQQPPVPQRSGPEPSIESTHCVIFRGKRYPQSSGIDVLVEAFTKLATEDPEFCRRYSERHRGRKKRRVARARHEIHPTDPDLRRRCRELPGGWWIDSNLNNRRKVDWIRQACEVAQIKYGHDLIVEFPDG